jgi:hypothetical protein
VPAIGIELAGSLVTNFINSRESFAHIDMKGLRAILKSYLQQWREIGQLATTPTFKGDERDVLAVLHDASEVGLMKFNADGWLTLTPEGEALSMAKAGRPIPRKDALKLVDKLKVSAAEFNKDEKSPISIRGVWLFGSLVEGSEQVGDVDIAIDTVDADWVPDDFITFNYIHQTYPGLISTAPWESYNATGDFMNRKLFGSRRPSRISIASMSTLKDLHCKCALIFSSDKQVEDELEVLDHHPDSTHRSRHVDPPKRIPELKMPGVLRPTCGKILAAVASDDRGEAHLVVDGDDGRAADFPLLEQIGPIDGEHHVAIVFGSRAAGYSKESRRPYIVAAERQVSSSGNTLSLTTSIQILRGAVTDVRFQRRDLAVAGKLLEILHGADIIRLSQRAAASGMKFENRISLAPEETDAVILYWFKAVLEQASAPAVATEDDGWEYQRRRNRNDRQLFKSSSFWGRYAYPRQFPG